MRKVSYLLTAVVMINLLMSACGSDDGEKSQKEDNIVPSSFRVDIPDAISHSSDESNNGQRVANVIIDGAVIYENMATFIKVGESASEIVETIMTVVYTFNLSQPIEFNYISDEDGRTKYVVIEEDVIVGGSSWEYKMVITDQDSTTAMQVVWNNTPVMGIAIISPYDLNRTENKNLSPTRYRIDYDETGNSTYEAEMTVAISGLPENYEDNGWINNLKMFAGKSGDVVEVYGTSNHPEFYFEYPEWKGRSYGFRARANGSLDIGVAEAGLPYSTTSTVDSVFHYSLEQVVFDIVRNDPQHDSVSDTDLAYYVDLAMVNEDAPAFFYNDKYQGSGLDNMPSDKGFTSSFADFDGLLPYKPADIAELSVDFLD